jgi:hypothetical protein
MIQVHFGITRYQSTAYPCPSVHYNTGAVSRTLPVSRDTRAHHPHAHWSCVRVSSGAAPTPPSHAAADGESIAEKRPTILNLEAEDTCYYWPWYAKVKVKKNQN